MAALEYKKLLISSLSPALPAEHLEDRPFHQFKCFAEFSLCFPTPRSWAAWPT